MRFNLIVGSWFVAIVLAVFAHPGTGMAAPALEIYGRLPGFEKASMSPSGNRIAILGTLSGQRQVVVLDADRKLITRLGVGAAAKVRGLTWVGDEAVLIDVTTTVPLNGDYTVSMAEMGTVFVMPMDGSPSWQVFGGDSDIAYGVSGYFGVARKDGHWFGYFGGVTKTTGLLSGDKYISTGKPDLYEVDLQTRKHHIVAKRAGDNQGWREWLLDDKGEVGATLDLIGHSGEWALGNGHSVKLASGVQRLGDVNLVGFTADGTGVIYWERDPVAIEDRHFIVPLAGGAAQPYLEGVAIQSWIRDEGHRVIGYVERNAGYDMHFFDPRREAIIKSARRAFPTSRLILADADRAFDRLLLVTEGSGDPETWWLVNMTTGHADRVGASYSLDPEHVGPMQTVEYSAGDGLKMAGILTLPFDRPGKALPAVILPHGGPADYDTIRFDWIAQAFVSRGYAVFQPNFRGSTGYGAKFEEAGNGEWGRKMQTDISDGLAELVRQGVVDPKRVCIVGASYGGYAALAGVTLQHGIYRCAVAIAGLGDLSRMVSTDTDERNDSPMLVRILKHELGSGQDLKAVSPVNFVDKVDAPVLLIHGKDDTVVHFAQSTEMLDALRHAGKPVEMVTLKAEDHWLSKSETRLQMLQASVDFVMKNNPPDPEPVSAKVP